MRVRAAVLRRVDARRPYADSEPLELTTVTLDDRLGPGELLVRVHAAGLCHSDLSVIQGLRPRPLPMVLGHEASGEVIATGPHVETVAVGDHVVLSFVPACGHCGPCIAERPALCEPGAAANGAGTLLSGDIRWSDERSAEPIFHHLGVSAFAERIVVSEASVVTVDRSLPFEIAALFGCAVMTGAGAVLNRANVRPGDRVAIFGLGGVGFAALLAARMAGAARIYAVDLADAKLKRAEALGAIALDAHDDVVEAIRAATDGGAEVVIETAGSVVALRNAYNATRRGGITVTVGLPAPDELLAIPALSLAAEERTLCGSYLGSCVPGRDVPLLVQAYFEDRLPVDELITHRLTLDQINEGFDRLADGEAVRQIVVM